MNRLIRTTFILSLCALAACCSPSDYDKGIDDGSSAFDEAKSALSKENQQQMDQFMAKMKVAMKSYIDDGKEKSKQQMGEMITALVCISQSQQGNVEALVRNTMAKAIQSDPNLRARMMGMATMDPQGLASAAEGFIEQIRQRAGGGNQISQGEAVMRSQAVSNYVNANTGTTGATANSYGLKKEASEKEVGTFGSSAGRGYGVTSTQPDILVPMAKLNR